MRIPVLLLSLSLLSACPKQAPPASATDGTATGPQETETGTSSPLAIPNLKTPTDALLLGGQPDTATFERAAQQGVTTVINLRGEGENEWDEQGVVEGLGMRYVHIPVAGAGGISTENATALRAALDATEGKVIVHCASGNRVGALFAVDAYSREGKTVDEALSLGREYGMTKLEDRVRELLQSLSTPPAP